MSFNKKFLSFENKFIVNFKMGVISKIIIVYAILLVFLSHAALIICHQSSAKGEDLNCPNVISRGF